MQQSPTYQFQEQPNEHAQALCSLSMCDNSGCPRLCSTSGYSAALSAVYKVTLAWGMRENTVICNLVLICSWTALQGSASPTCYLSPSRIAFEEQLQLHSDQLPWKLNVTKPGIAYIPDALAHQTEHLLDAASTLLK